MAEVLFHKLFTLCLPTKGSVSDKVYLMCTLVCSSAILTLLSFCRLQHDGMNIFHKEGFKPSYSNHVHDTKNLTWASVAR